MKKILLLTLSLPIAFLSANIYANPNGCEQFAIQVLNKTDSECIYQNYRMQKGYLIDTSPSKNVIPANGSQLFVTQQSLAQGPTIEIDYLCNGRKITIESHQNLCVLSSGKIRGEILSKDEGITASYSTTTGDYYWSYPGRIYWALENAS